MNFILSNKIFEYTICILIIINCIATAILPIIINKSKNKDNKIKNYDLFDKCTLIINFFWLTVALGAILFIIIKFKLSSIVILLFYIVFFIYSFREKGKNMASLSYENKNNIIQASFLYILLLSSKSIFIYSDYLKTIPNNLKEYIIIIFVIIRLLFFIYYSILHISILISSITIIFNKQIIIMKNKCKKFIDKTYIIEWYNFNISKRGTIKKLIIIDLILSAFIYPLSLLLSGIKLFFIYICKYLIKILLRIDNLINYYLNNSAQIISKYMKISIIICLIITYFLLLYNSKGFSNNTIIFYNQLITVVLIPLIYDNIKK